MMRYFSWIITIPFTVFAILFIVGNKDYVPLTYWIDTPPYELPLYAIGLAMLGIGFLGGAFFVSLSFYALRHEYWKTKRKLNRLEQELENQKRTEAEKEDAPTTAIAEEERLQIAKSY